MDINTLSSDVAEISDTYAEKFGIKRDSDWYILKLQEELGELIQAYLMRIGQARLKGKSQKELREDFESEVGDVLCHVLLLARHFDVDVDTVVRKKWLSWKKKTP
jgi:NTP pyrophosphatase (non-canonical NTP hydrolase)